jgi:hypothetical protein
MQSNPDHGQVYSIQLNVIKFVIDLRYVGGVLPVLLFPLPIAEKNSVTCEQITNDDNYCQLDFDSEQDTTIVKRKWTK